MLSDQERYVELLRQNGATIEGKAVLDVGSGSGEFVRHAQQIGAKESWGVEHNKRILDGSLHQFGMSAVNRDHLLHMPFSEIPEKRPDLKGKFDVIKITAITPYANANELKRMAHTAHFLLKKDGHILLELPWMNLMNDAFRADQSAEENTGIIERYARLTKPSKARKEIELLQTAYKTLFSAYFDTAVEVTSIGKVKALVISNPKEIIPDINTIRFDDRMLRLSPIPGVRPSGAAQAQ